MRSGGKGVLLLRISDLALARVDNYIRVLHTFVKLCVPKTYEFSYIHVFCKHLKCIEICNNLYVVHGN